MMRTVLVLGTAVVALLPTGAARASFRFEPQCPMPVTVPDSVATERMPVTTFNAAVPMPTQLPMCSNPLFARRDAAGAGVVPTKREPSQR